MTAPFPPFMPPAPPLIGREQDIKLLSDLVCNNRMVSIIGPGGCGKTHLALHLAHVLAENFSDGVVCARLDAITDPLLVEPTLLLALQLQEQMDAPLTSTLIAALAPRQMLLILDNCEHVLTTCASLVGQLVSACPELRILVTSREPLAISVEQQWRLAPLSLPAAATPITVMQCTEFGALALFQQRAAEKAPHFTLTDENIDMVCALCRMLDGLPLAIELAAARLTIMTPAQMVEALQNGQDILATCAHNGSRHYSMTTTLAWSYDALPPIEQALFRRLALSAGACDLELVIALGTPLCEHRHMLLDSLAHLVAASFIEVEYRAEKTGYRLLETVRQFGRERLRLAGEEADAYHSYGQWACEVVQCAEQALHGGEQGEWLARIEQQLDHLRAVMHWHLSHTHPEQALAIATALAQFWVTRGSLVEGRHWLESGLTRIAGTAHELTRCRALLALGQILARQREFQQAARCYEHARAGFQALAERQDEAFARQQAGILAVWMALPDQARPLLEESLRDLCEGGSDAWTVALGLHRLGTLEMSVGKFAEALAYFAQSLAMRRELADRVGSADTYLNMGNIHYWLGDVSQAMVCARMSFTLYRELQHWRGCVDALINLAECATSIQDLNNAERWFAEALQFTEHTRADFREPFLIAQLADIAKQRGMLQRAARLGGIAEQWYCAQLEHPANVTPEFQTLQQWHVLAGSEIGAAWAEGASMPRRDALAYVLEPISAAHPKPAMLLRSTETDTQQHDGKALRLCALDMGRIYLDNQMLAGHEQMYPKTRELLFYLLTHQARSREQICGALWPDALETRTYNSLRVTIHRVRQALGSAQWIQYADGVYTFNRKRSYFYDVHAFEQTVKDARAIQSQAPNKAIALLQSACALYQGDFLDGLTTSEWSIQPRYELQRRFHETLFALAHLHFADGDFARALDIWYRLVAHDPYHEAAHRGILACYLQLEEPARAQQHFDQFAQQLATNLGVAPMPETIALLSAIRQAT